MTDKNETMLFIGGPWDGMRVDVHRSAEVIQVPIIPPMNYSPEASIIAATPYEAAVYVRNHLSERGPQGDRINHSVMLFRDEKSLIGALIKGYKPEVK